MALYYDTNEAGDRKVYVGDDLTIRSMREHAPAVVSVQADGDELEAIRQQFTNIPMHNGKIVEWFGSTARFIARNFQ